MSGMRDPILSVIIINWNGARYLPRCLQSLRGQTQSDVQVILADNGSTDESVPLTRRDYPEVEIVEFGHNLGYAEGNNRAAAQSHAKYLLFLNNDTHLHRNALQALVRAAEARPDLPILAPQQCTYDGDRRLHVGLGVDILGYPGEGKLFYADGAALFIRRHVFQALHGFDDSYFMFGEDSDLCWRAWLKGYRVGAVPQAIIYHLSGGTAGSSIVQGNRHETSRTKRRLAHRNQLATLLKNYSLPSLCFVLPLFTLVTAGELVLLTLTGQRSVIDDIYLAAWRDLLRSRCSLRRDRRRVQRSRVVSDWTILGRMAWTVHVVSLFFRIGMPRVR